MSNENLIQTIREFKEWKQIQEEAAAKMEELKNLITSEMDAQGLDKMNVDVFTVKNITVTNQRFAPMCGCGSAFRYGRKRRTCESANN